MITAYLIITGMCQYTYFHKKKKWMAFSKKYSKLISDDKLRGNHIVSSEWILISSEPWSKWSQSGSGIFAGSRPTGLDKKIGASVSKWWEAFLAQCGIYQPDIMRRSLIVMILLGIVFLVRCFRYDRSIPGCHMQRLMSLTP